MNPVEADPFDPAAAWTDFEALAVRRHRIPAANVLARLMAFTGDPPFILCQVAEFVARELLATDGPFPAFRFVRNKRLRSTSDDAYEIVALYIDFRTTGNPLCKQAAERVARNVYRRPQSWWLGQVTSEILDMLPPTSDEHMTR